MLSRKIGSREENHIMGDPILYKILDKHIKERVGKRIPMTRIIP